MIQNDSSISPSTPIRSTNSNRTNSYGVQFGSDYESRILGRIEADHPHFILIDDVHQIEHPNKPTIDGWGVPVAELLKDVPGRHVVVTASAGIQVERELESVAIPAEDYDIQPILPEKFRDYLFTLYPDLEEEENRVSPTSLRTGENSLPAALKSGEIESFVAELRQKYEKVAGVERRIQSQVVDYLAMGGTISYDLDGAAESAADLTAGDYAQLREDVRNALYQEVPGFESIQTIADLERLCALAARNRGLSRSGIRTSSNCSMSTGERSPIATFPRWQSCTC